MCIKYEPGNHSAVNQFSVVLIQLREMQYDSGSARPYIEVFTSQAFQQRIPSVVIIEALPTIFNLTVLPKTCQQSDWGFIA